MRAVFDAVRDAAVHQFQRAGACYAIVLKDPTSTVQSQGRLQTTEQCTDAERKSDLIGATQTGFQGFDHRGITCGGQYGCTGEDLKAAECIVIWFKWRCGFKIG